MSFRIKQAPARHIASLALASAFLSPAAALAQTTFSVSFNDPNATYSSYYANIQNSILAAGNAWLSHFNTGLPATNLAISVSFTNISTLNGTSGVYSNVGTRSDGVNILEQGAAHKLKTGIDDNGSAADILFQIGTNYLQNTMWFGDSSQTVPTNKVDAVSSFTHEFGHAWGFNGLLDATTGIPRYTNYQTTFDTSVSLNAAANGGPTLFFTGANAEAVYGGPVPLTYGNYTHVGNAAPRDGSALVSDVMNGVAFYYGKRYQISNLDLAILADAGLPVAAVPEPSTFLLLLTGVGALLVWRRRKLATTLQ